MEIFKITTEVIYQVPNKCTFNSRNLDLRTKNIITQCSLSTPSIYTTLFHFMHNWFYVQLQRVHKLSSYVKQRLQINLREIELEKKIVNRKTRTAYYMFNLTTTYIVRFVYIMIYVIYIYNNYIY